MENDYKSLAEELKKYIGEPCTEGVAVAIAVTEKHFLNEEEEREDGKVVYNGINVRPINGNTLYCMAEIVDFTRYHKLNEFVTMTSEWNSETNTYKNNINCHIF